MSFIVAGAATGTHSILPRSSASMSIFSSQTICQAISFAVRDLGSGRYSDPSGIRASTLWVVFDSLLQKPWKSAFSSIVDSASLRTGRTRGLEIDSSGRSFFRGRLVECAFHRVFRIRRDGVIAPEPAHHVREDRGALFLSVPPDPPRVIEVVALVGQRAHQRHVLQEPVARRVI